jgi:hypothetical protein
MPLYRLHGSPELIAPTMITALDGWVDAGSAATTAAGQLAEDGEAVATFNADLVFDYRARRPTLHIVDGRPGSLDWPELVIRHRRLGDHDLLILTGPEPDFRWHELADDLVALADTLGVTEWISLGAIPAAVPHTRPVPVLGTESRRGGLRGGVQAGPSGLLRVPAAAISVIDLAVTAAGVPAVGYFAQIPHYVSGVYPSAAIELLRAVGRHLDEAIDTSALQGEADALQVRLSAAAAADDTTRTYVERLEAMVDEARLPSGDDLISEIERFLRDQGGPGSGSGGSSGSPGGGGSGGSGPAGGSGSGGGSGGGPTSGSGLE